MREGIGSIALYNIIIIFIAVTFAVLAGTMSYSKAFKVNNRIINAIEKYEGYNQLAAEKIDVSLLSIGYQLSNGKKNCGKRRGIDALESLNASYDFCVYKNIEETREWNGRYSTYGVVSYINLDLPVVGSFFKIPVYGRSKMVFSFDEENAPAPQISKYLFITLKDNEIVKEYNKNARLTFLQGSSVDLSTLIQVNLISSDGVSFPVTDYVLDGFSTDNLVEEAHFWVHWGGLKTFYTYAVVPRG